MTPRIHFDTSMEAAGSGVIEFEVALRIRSDSYKAALRFKLLTLVWAIHNRKTVGSSFKLL